MEPSKRQKKAVASKRQRASKTKPIWDKATPLVAMAEDMPKKKPGFKKVAKKIAAKQGIPEENARAILAAGARKASPAAKKANPALKKVQGKKSK